MVSHRVLSALLLVTSRVVQAQATHIGRDNRYSDTTLTPGAVFDVTAEQVCVPGYSRGVHKVPSAERAQVYAGTPWWMFGVRTRSITSSRSGSKRHRRPMAQAVRLAGRSRKRPRRELPARVCRGALALADAQQMIVNDWYAVYMTLADAAAETDAIGEPSSTPVADSSSTVPAASASDQALTIVRVNGGPAWRPRLGNCANRSWSDLLSPVGDASRNEAHRPRPGC
jgi:hypothetical protein